MIDVNADGKDDILYGGIKLSVYRWTGAQDSEYSTGYNPAFQLLVSGTPFDNFVFHDPPESLTYDPSEIQMDDDRKLRKFDLVDLAPTACE